MADAPRRKRRELKPGIHAVRNRTVAKEEELRQIFRNANILGQEREGKLTRTVLKSGDFTVKLEGEDDYVRTVITGFFTLSNDEVARTHHYERRDGSIAASGLLDPKRVMWNGILYYKE